MIVFAIKELGKLISIFGEWEVYPYTQAELFKFHIDFISDATELRRVKQHPPEARVDPISEELLVPYGLSLHNQCSLTIMSN